MDVTLSKVLPTGIGTNPASSALDAARSALTPSLRGGDSVLSPQSSALGGVEDVGGAGSVIQSFSALLSQAVQDINQTQQVADDGAAKLAAGEPVDLHNVMIGMENANLSLGLALQVRNKLLEAYQEVMRMTI